MTVPNLDLIDQMETLTKLLRISPRNLVNVKQKDKYDRRRTQIPMYNIKKILKWVTMNSPHDGTPHEEFDNEQIIIVPRQSLPQIFKASQRR